jgi:hypothetical protein
VSNCLDHLIVDEFILRLTVCATAGAGKLALQQMVNDHRMVTTHTLPREGLKEKGVWAAKR